MFNVQRRLVQLHLETFRLFANDPLPTESFPIVIFAVVNGNVLKASGSFCDKWEIIISEITNNSTQIVVKETINFTKIDVKDSE